MARSQSDQTIRLNSFSGGVSTKPFTKRMPTEVSALDNATVSVETNLQKRPGTESVSKLSIDTAGLGFSGYSTDLFLHFIDRGDDADTYLISVASDGVITISDGKSGELLDTVTPNAEQAAYLTAGSSQMATKLLATTVLDSTFILNTEVEAKFKNAVEGASLTYQKADLSQAVRLRDRVTDATTGELEDASDAQNLTNFSYLPFPPEAGDASAANGEESVVGLGKVFYTREPYLDNPSGFYQTISEDYQPYYRQIRTESVGSVFDELTWPLILKSNTRTDWELTYPDWKPRTAGNDLSNPGPSALANTANPRGSQPDTTEQVAVRQYQLGTGSRLMIDNSEAATGIADHFETPPTFQFGPSNDPNACSMVISFASTADYDVFVLHFRDIIDRVYLGSSALTGGTIVNTGLVSVGADPVIPNSWTYELQGADCLQWMEAARTASSQLFFQFSCPSDQPGGRAQPFAVENPWNIVSPNTIGVIDSIVEYPVARLHYTFDSAANAAAFAALDQIILTDEYGNTDEMTATVDSGDPEIVTLFSTSPADWHDAWFDGDTVTARIDTNTLSDPVADERTGVKLVEMTFWRNRLWFASNNTIFSSQLDDLFNFWIHDPDVLTDTDPVDVLVSNGRVTQVRNLVPFSDFMFIQTGGKTQYELQGSNNFISPSTAVVEPTSFYGSYATTEPFRMGSQLYWLDAQRLYLYSPAGTAETAQAIDMSKHCPGYLPSNFGSTVVASEIDTTFFVDSDVPNHLYLYKGQWLGDKQVQSAFSRWTFAEGTAIQKVYSVDGHLYLVVSRNGELYLERCRLELPTTQDISSSNLPLLDSAVLVSDQVYDSGANTTTFTLDGYFPNSDTVVCVAPTSDEYGVVRTGTVTVDVSGADPVTTVVVSGELTDQCVVGVKFNMTCQLSRAAVKDGNMQTIDGTLTLKQMTVKHFNSGAYQVTVEDRGRYREPTTTEHDILPVGDYQSPIDSLPIESVGELTTRIGGDADTTDIVISGDGVYPIHITNVELYGSFRGSQSNPAL